MSYDDLNFDGILDFVAKKEYDGDLIKMAKDYNSSIGEYGLENKCGLSLGKGIKELPLLNEEYIDVIAKTVSGIDARMSGVSQNVVINSGSGNQGITATVPIVEMAKILNVDSEMELDALALSHLITLYIRSKQRKLSTACGAVCVASGVAAGITYILGGTKSQIKVPIINCLCSSFGMFCVGAKQPVHLKFYLV